MHQPLLIADKKGVSNGDSEIIHWLAAMFQRHAVHRADVAVALGYGVAEGFRNGRSTSCRRYYAPRPFKAETWLLHNAVPQGRTAMQCVAVDCYATRCFIG